MMWVSLIVGLVVLTVGSDLLVRGASRLALALGVTPLIVGLTVVAFGTSAPELAVSLQGALSGQADVAMGNVVGSNIFNVLVILGLSALIAPLAVDRTLLRVDVPLMTIGCLATYAFARDGVISRPEGVILFTGIIGYTWRAIRHSRASGQESVEGVDVEAVPRSMAQTAREVAFMVAGLVCMVLGARWFVSGGVELARLLGMSELLIGLTIVAAGTSLPEVATSVMATLRGERDIAVGNAIGSNIFNIFSVLGAASAISPTGVPVAPAAFAVDMPVMIGAALLCFPILFTNRTISRIEGAILLGCYGLYLAYLALSSSNSPALHSFTGALVWCAGALVLFLIVNLIQHHRAESSATPV
jgi:cation:H+ antiporter